MTKIYINGNLIAAIDTVNPHGALREILINAEMNGKKVEIVRA